MATEITLTAVYEAIDGGGYIGYIVELPGVNIHGETLDEVRESLADAIQIMLELDYCTLEFQEMAIPFYPTKSGVH